MKWKENSQQFENPPVGSHIARCYAVIDLGTQPHTYKEKVELQRQVRISFELPEERMEGLYNPDLKGKPFAVHLNNIKQSLHPKARLRKLLEGWRGRKFSKEELEGFDPKKMVGSACRITLIENGEYINIDSISPLGKKEKCPKQVNPSVFFSMAEDEDGQSEFDPKVYKALHEKTREKIAASPEYKALFGGEEPQGEPEHGGEPEGAQADPDEDDTPF
jgi:hypothetical protein